MAFPAQRTAPLGLLALAASAAVLGGGYLWLHTDAPARLRRLAAFARAWAALPPPTRLRSRDGRLEVRVSALGACVTALRVDGRDVVLGFPDDTLLGLLRWFFCSPYFGAVVGRVANRLRDAAGGAGVSVDGRHHALAGNEAGGRTALHGGEEGFDKRVWRLAPSPRSVTCFLRSGDGDQGFPGTADVTVKYSLEEVHGAGGAGGARNAVLVEMLATADAPTPVCLAQHTYFNLNGHAAAADGTGEIEGVGNHTVEIDASRITPVDAELIPTGEFMDVGGTAFDLRPPGASATVSVNPLMVSPPRPDEQDYDYRFPDGRLGARIRALVAEQPAALGFDHNYCLDGSAPCPYARGMPAGRPPDAAAFDGMHRVASVSAPGAAMELYSDQRGVQFYTGNFLDELRVRGKRGLRYGRHAGLCLETQSFPNAANVDAFPDVTLRPGGVYRHRMLYVFGGSGAAAA